MKIVVIRAEYGEVKEKYMVEGDFERILKDVIVKTLELWEPSKSDLIVLRHEEEIEIKLPIKKEQYDIYHQYNLRRKGEHASIDIPVYIVSYENKMVGDSIADLKVYLVAPYIDETITAKLEELAKTITTPREEEELEEE